MASHSNTCRNFLDAAFTGNLKLLKKLALDLDHGDGIARSVARVKDADGRTGLHLASAAGKTHVCKYLIEDLKLDVNAKDGRGETPLHHATLGEHLPTAIYLLENGSNPCVENDNRLTVLHYAAEKGIKKLLRLLISKGAVVDAKADSGTPLQFAAAHGKKEAVKILLDNSANPNLIFHQIFSPLVVSILANSFDCLNLLLKAGADPNISSCGLTPLIAAASEGETGMIKRLLKAGANPDITNNFGLTPVEIAAIQGNHNDVMILFPMTTRIPTISNWSVGGIINYVHSEEAKQQRKLKVKEHFLLSKSKGEDAFKKKDYVNAVYWYTEAINADPCDAAVLSNRSLCWARLNEGSRALSDAQACLVLRPDWPKAHYREGVAYNLLKQYHRASESFLDGLKLDPENKELNTAFWEAAGDEMKHMCGETTPLSW